MSRLNTLKDIINQPAETLEAVAYIILTCAALMAVLKLLEWIWEYMRRHPNYSAIWGLIVIVGGVTYVTIDIVPEGQGIAPEPVYEPVQEDIQPMGYDLEGFEDLKSGDQVRLPSGTVMTILD